MNTACGPVQAMLVHDSLDEALESPSAGGAVEFTTSCYRGDMQLVADCIAQPIVGR